MIPDDSNSSSRIIIQHLDEEFGSRWIRDNFSKFGTIIDIDVSKASWNSRRSDKIFVQYASPDSVSQAVKEMNGKRVGDRIISVSSFENSEFNRLMQKQVFLKGEDVVGKEEGLEPPAYQKIPRRDPESQYMSEIKRPETPQEPPPIYIPKPPLYEQLPVNDYNALIQMQAQNKQTMPNYEEHEQNDETSNMSREDYEKRRREERHERHNRERDRSDRRRRDERRERRHHNDRDRDIERSRDRYDERKN